MKKEIKINDSVIVTVTLITDRELDCNHNIKKACCEISVDATIDGKDVGGLGNMVAVDHPVAVARIGKLYLKADTAELVQSAINEIETSEYVVEWRANEDKALSESTKYDSHCEMMRNAMAE